MGLEYNSHKAIRGQESRVFLELVDFGSRITFRMAVYSHPDPAINQFLELQPVKFELRDENCEQGQPAFTMDKALAQALADELWRIGFRPTQGKQSEGEAGARMKHLEDMRAIAFAKLDVQRPEAKGAHDR